MPWETSATHILEIRVWSAQSIWKIWVTYYLNREHCQPCIINWDNINSHPHPWKWHKTFPNYIFSLEPSLRIDTVITIEHISLHLFNRCSVQCTHQLKAVLTLNSRFPLCTAKSINAMTSSLSATAVFSIRPLQWLSFEFMSVKQVHQHVNRMYTFESHVLRVHIWHHYQADASSAPETASPPHRIHYPSIYLGHRIHPFQHWRWTGRIWWTMRWRELQTCALNTVIINARNDAPFGSEQMPS